MKRAFLAILILATGTTVFCAFHATNTGLRQELASQRAAWQTQTQQLIQLHLQKQQIFERWSDTKQLLAAQPPLPVLTQLAEKILSGVSLENLSVTESEQLLAELGFSWNTTGDYLIVSKKSLAGISFDGMKGVKLADVARAVFAITPAEQGEIETMTQQLGDARTAWAKEHVQRTEPSGDVLAQYSLPVDAEFSRSQLAVFTNGIFNALGNERGQWLQNHSIGWMMDVGLRNGQDFSKIPEELRAAMPTAEYETQPTTLTVERYKSGDEWRMNYRLKQAGNSMMTSVSPWQPFPEAFRPIFPGGWEDLAQREGFELPKEFKKQKAQ
jgi:hypothetical protein